MPQIVRKCLHCLGHGIMFVHQSGDILDIEGIEPGDYYEAITCDTCNGGGYVTTGQSADTIGD